MIEANSRVTSVVIILNVLRPKHSRNSNLLRKSNLLLHGVGALPKRNGHQGSVDCTATSRSPCVDNFRLAEPLAR
jgi:hypothetical protein